MANEPRRAFALLLTSVLFCGAANAQKSHRSWTTDNGLPQNTVQDILQTHDGFLWIATEKGISRFDGFDFVNYSHENTPDLVNDDVLKLAEDASGALIIKTAKGTFHFSQGHFAPALDLHKPSSKEIRSSQGSTWTYEGDEVERHGPGGIDSRWKLSSPGTSNRVQALLVDSRNVAWVGTRRGLFEIDAGKLKPIDDLANDSILCLFEDREGDIWIGGGATGLHLLSPRSIESVPAFANRGITTVAAAANGDTWAGTPEDGLLCLHQGKVRSITAETGLSSNVVLSLAVSSDGAILAGSPDGLNTLVHGHVSSVLRSEAGLPDDFIRSILFAPDGSIWAGTRRGIAHLADGRVTVLDHARGLPSDLVGSLLYAANGDLWIGTLYGAARLRGNQLQSFEPNDGVTSLVEGGRGKIWMGTATTGLYLWDGAIFRNVRSAAIPTKIFGLLDDANGYLWIRTHSGLVRVLLDDAESCALRNVCDFSVRIFNSSDGLPANDIFDAGHPGQVRDREGILYFATRRGLAKINPLTLQSNSTVPLPVVTQLTVDNRPRPIQLDNTVALEPSDRRMTLFYVAPSFRQPGKVHYRYRLEGFDKDWVDGGTNRSVSYTNLSPGRHRFSVMAANEDGIWSKTPAELVMVVRPPVYRRWWFYLSLVLVGGGIFFLLYWLHERKLKQQFAAVLLERSRIAREIHDTLAQDLAGVSVQLEVVSSLMKKNQSEAAAMQLEETKTVVRDGLATARRSIWELRDSVDEQILPVRAKRLAEQAAGRPEVVRFEIKGPYRPLSHSAETEILNIMKEAIRNSVHHSGTSEVEVSLHYRSTALTLTVQDRGRGFDTSGTPDPGHYGLQGMRERAAMIGATMTIESTAGQGSCVTLIAPLK